MGGRTRETPPPPILPPGPLRRLRSKRPECGAGLARRAAVVVVLGKGGRVWGCGAFI
ncbi:hypothetical protein GCM10010415_27080 [Streptomyces atrovirens]